MFHKFLTPMSRIGVPLRDSYAFQYFLLIVTITKYANDLWPHL